MAVSAYNFLSEGLSADGAMHQRGGRGKEARLVSVKKRRTALPHWRYLRIIFS